MSLIQKEGSGNSRVYFLAAGDCSNQVPYTNRVRRPLGKSANQIRVNVPPLVHAVACNNCQYHTTVL